VGVDSGQGHRVELIGEGVEAGSRAGFALENGSATISVAPAGVSPTESNCHDVQLLLNPFRTSLMFRRATAFRRSVAGLGGHFQTRVPE